ncbi:Hpt domain-containing protein [uncultured Sunxiuqinia sp.]|uniref:Hpt domain-containing protein n=1 Tax=uncultured Sunxiuqinia sp. TaxID=1573825 RepID=UPI002AA66754|nr:Hpt domain-containing protein [uncultured Sunxiuqinia sp.]
MKTMKEEPNLLYIRELSEGDTDFEMTLLQVVKKELPAEIEVYKQQLAEENYSKTAESVHKLKHKISILGLEKSYQTAVDYENELKEGQTRLQAEFEEILDSMVAFIGKL